MAYSFHKLSLKLAKKAVICIVVTLKYEGEWQEHFKYCLASYCLALFQTGRVKILIVCTGDPG